MSVALFNVLIKMSEMAEKDWRVSVHAKYEPPKTNRKKIKKKYDKEWYQY